ncbi:MAG: DUF481 domain-containing protein [Opitutales bacterium]|jgi:opacity protein-like surface antigen
MKTRGFSPLFALFLTMLPLRAAVVELSNGDRLSGEIISRDDDQLTLRSPIFGDLELPLSEVAQVTGDEPAPASDALTAEPPPAMPQAPAARHARGALRAATAALLDRINILRNWKSNLNIGLSFLTGQTNSRSTNLSFNSERDWTKDSMRLELTQEYEIAETDEGEDAVTRNKLKATARFRHDLDNTMFVQSDSQYFFAKAKGIDHDVRQSMGLGWRLSQTDRLNINLTPSVTAQYQVIRGEDQSISCSPTLYEEVIFNWTPSINLRQEASALFPVTGETNDPSFHFAATLQNKFTDNLSMNLEYLFDYDGSVARNTEAGQHSLRMGLGMSF